MKKRAIAGSLFVLILALVTVGSFGYTITRAYDWNFQGQEWSWTLQIDSADYYFFKNLPRVSDYSLYVTNPYDDQWLSSLIEAFKQGARDAGYNERQTIDLLISFVQSLPYTSDNITTGYDEYPRYPIETLVDRGGDCEDTSILAAALLWQMGYDVVLLEYSGHMAVGVAGDQTVTGTYYEYNGRQYFYLETTGKGWKIGKKPAGLPSSARIIPLSPKPLLYFSWESIPWERSVNTATYQVRVTIKNYGSETSYGTLCYVALESDQEGYVWDQRETTPTDIVPLASEEVTFYLKAPRQKWTRVYVAIWSSNSPRISDQSKWLKP